MEKLRALAVGQRKIPNFPAEGESWGSQILGFGGYLREKTWNMSKGYLVIEYFLASRDNEGFFGWQNANMPLEYLKMKERAPY